MIGYAKNNQTETTAGGLECDKTEREPIVEMKNQTPTTADRLEADRIYCESVVQVKRS